MLKYEFETIDCNSDGGWSLFGGFGIESVEHRAVICRRGEAGWRYVGFLPRRQRAEGFVESIDLVFERQSPTHEQEVE